ncbi:PilZ domain-containing protein [Hydrogenovibrio kuenenii]|uniref:PilZ domain-containing protein n=1 Tax=Hydrogenovibrio kuenenii TaxID=63658 RepID=UPI000466532C|nr:PilZ domain-containing protein [Hydrogenovibrio kuenenii]
MGFWFENGDSRRFQRVEMPIKTYIFPTQPIRDRDIFALGINYFPPSVVKKIQKTKVDLWHWVTHIQEQREILEPVFLEVIDLVDSFGEIVKQISVGKNELKNPQHREKLLHLQKGFLGIRTLKDPAPKTFQYFGLMDQKFSVYTENLIQSMAKSTPIKFEINSDFQTEFEIDKIIATFEDPKFEHIPLARALYYLATYIDLHLNAYYQLLKDLKPSKTPKSWDTYRVNISACGAAIYAPKRYALNSKVEVIFYFTETGEMLKLKASVVHTFTQPKEQTESNALDFDFPTGMDQAMIQRQIELYQIIRCMDFDL